MTLVYHVDIEDTTGNTVAIIKNPISFSCTTRIGQKGDYQLVLSGFDSVVNLIQEDYIIRFWRKDTTALLSNGMPTDFVNVFTGIHKTPSKSLTQSGQKTFTSYGPDSNELLDKSYILYAPNSSQASKSAAASTAMIEFVRENIGDLALISNGRRTDGTNPIVILGTNGLGSVWSDNVANKNLLTVLQNIRDYTRQTGTQIDFEMQYLGNYSWGFRCGTNVYVNRTNVGLDPTTGLNSDGNRPIVFSPLLNNVKNFFESKSRYNEVNSVTVIGSGVGALQQTVTRKNLTSVLTSPIAQRETVTNSNDSSLAQLNYVGDSALYELTAQTKISFEPLLNQIRVYRDFNVGDFVTAINENNEVFQQQLVELTINVSQSESGSTIEQLNFNFENAVL